MGVDKNEIKEKAKKAFAAAKNFSQKHELGKKFGIVALLAAAKAFDSWTKKDNSNDEEDYYQLLDNHTNLYVSNDPEKFSKMEAINNELGNKKHPKEKEYKTFSDEKVEEEFQNELSKRESVWDELDKKYNGSFDKMAKDPDYSSYNKHSSNVGQLQIEQQRRYKEKNPDKFPRSREHGFDLYKKEKD